MRSSTHSRIALFKKILFFLTRVFLGYYLVIFVVVWFFMGKLIFMPEKLDSDFQFSFAHPFEERWFEVEGEKVHSLYFHEPKAKGLILYFHGNAGSLKDWGHVGMGLSGQFQYDVWIVDYPGYGKSGGSIQSEQQLFAMAEAMWSTATKSFAPERIIIYGRSIGTGIAVHLASQHPSGGLILESPYLSLVSMINARVLYFPEAFVPIPMRSDLRIGKIDAPILILHGENDDVIPLSQGEKLARLARNVKFVKVPGGFHNDLSDYDVFNEAVIEWINNR